MFQFYYDGSQILAKSSQDASTWIEAATLPYNTSDFSVYFRDGRVYVAVTANTYDVVVRRGIVTNGTIAFEGEVTALDGTSETDSYSRPSIIVRDDSRIFVAAANVWSIYSDDTYPVVAESAGAGVMSFAVPLRIARPKEDIKSIILIYSGSGVEVSAFVQNEEDVLSHQRFDSSDWLSANIGGDEVLGGFIDRGLLSTVLALTVYNGELHIGADAGLYFLTSAVTNSGSLFSVGPNLETYYGQSGISSKTYNTSTWQAPSALTADAVQSIVAGELGTFWVTNTGALKNSGGLLVASGAGSALSVASTTGTSILSYPIGLEVRSGQDGVGLDDDWDNDGLSFANEVAEGTDAYDSDTDDDGALDGAEIAAGSNPFVADTEGDGIDDGSEFALGLNPNAYEYPLSSPAYLGWNTFLGMNNILELSNRANSFQAVTVRVLDAAGAELGTFVVGLGIGEKRDILLDSFLPENAYGNVKLDFTSHALRARTTQYYRSGPNYSYHNEARDGLTGVSYVLFNTYDPSVAMELVVENWLSITNEDSDPEFFTVTKYDVNGSVAEVQGITVPGQGRLDIDGGLGGVAAGYVKIVPANPTTEYQASLVRMGRRNLSPSAQDDGMLYQYAAQLDALAPSTNTYASLSGVSFIEVANICDSAEGISVSVYQEDGTADFQNSYSLDANTHTHIGTQATGYVEVSSTNPCIIMSVLRYQGDVTGLSSSQGQEPRDGMVSGRYNTFLNQTATLLMSNTSASTESVTITFRDAQGGTSAETVSLEPNASYQMQVPAAVDSYGTVDVTGDNVMASVLYSAPNFSDSLECR